MTGIRGSSRYNLCTCITFIMINVSDKSCRDKRREENQLDATEWLTALTICSICFGHLYAYHQELETMNVILPHMMCNALVAGGPRSGAGQMSSKTSSPWGAVKIRCPETSMANHYTLRNNSKERDLDVLLLNLY